jgi:hypothetical protein
MKRSYYVTARWRKKLQDRMGENEFAKYCDNCVLYFVRSVQGTAAIIVPTLNNVGGHESRCVVITVEVTAGQVSFHLRSSIFTLHISNPCVGHRINKQAQ